MNTTKNTHRSGTATAILLGFALAATPIAAHANQAGAAPAIVPSGPDIVLAATENLRQLVETDRAPAVLVRPADKSLRQVMEEDRAAVAMQSRPADKPLRQMMEEDRAPDAPPRTAVQLPVVEDDPPSEVSPRSADKTLRQLMEEDSR
ncbi:hypothetical protein LQ757_09685 [Agromyces sp. SYSU K20354]|uniref:hypothetical protein n=1 Tax=Agromyces cavernae TaxID=2898659 RepID=UPI001E2ECA20|nr:hypothetical protein [Agromyces cavernae]MCD2442543.1 hypothetical protein [Agromyces cavernae]